MLNSNMYSPAGAWEQGLCPVGRVALIPTSIYISKYLIVQGVFICQYYLNKEQLFYARLCRDEGNSTYGFYFMPIIGALKKSILQDVKCC